jgi:hypothetical protein
MIRDYLRHSDLHVTNKYLQATTKSKRLAQGKLVDAVPTSSLLPIIWKGGTANRHPEMLIGPKRTPIVFGGSL